MRLVSSAALVAVTVSVSSFSVLAAPVRIKSEPRPAYGSFLVGRYAMATGDIGTASSALNRAAINDPTSLDIREKAFLVAILNGDIDRAQSLNPQVETGAGKLMAGLVGAVTAVKANRAGPALRSVDTVLKNGEGERSASLLRPYILAMGGNWKAALDDSGDAALNSSDSGRLLVYLLKSERARLLEMKGRAKDAEAVYTSLYQPGAASFVFGPDYASFLERQGRKEEARVVWKAMSEQSNDPVARQSLKRLDVAGAKAAPVPDLKASMAQSLLLAATLYSSDRDSEMALANLRLSLYLDPTSDRARIFLGQVNQELKDSASAEAAWAAVPASSPYGSEAALRLVWSLRGRGDNDGALRLVEAALVRSPDDIAFVAEQADILHAQGKDEAALKVLDDRASRAGEADFTWQARFIQAVTYDSLDRWPEAEAAISKARAIAGDRPEILNFIGYGWINRDLKVKEGMDMVRQALSQTPRSAAIVDSLGWGYYKLGQYEQALSYIEQAVQMDPADAEINEHLGDVYHAMGREVEAGYEWQRVLTLDPSAREIASVRAKLDAQAARLAAGSGIGLKQPMTVKAETAFNDKAVKPK